MANIDASFYDTESKVLFRRVFKNRKGFLSALSRMKGRYTFLNAVDVDRMMVVKPDNLEVYRNDKV